MITFRPDNLLTVGLLGAMAYGGALLLAQLLMRAGLVKSAPAPAGAGK